MYFLQLLYQLLIAPLELIFEFTFGFFYEILGDIGMSIIPLSLIVNFLLLPFYRRADQIQKEQHAIEEKLAPGIDHLKKTFTGDKRFMILQTYYRQNHYSPLSALRSSYALLLEVPFFIAAYRFLSHFEPMKGTSFGILSDLGSPDGLIVIGGLTINALPIFMTLVNIVSSKLYAKDLSKKDEIRMYAMSLIFLILLYRSPSGLVFYWTLNNIFSLFKNLIAASSDKKTVTNLLFLVMSMLTLMYAAAFYRGPQNKRLYILAAAVILLLPVIHNVLFANKNKEEKKEKKSKEEKPRPSGKIFIFSSLFLSVLTGILIPSAVVRSSPVEFVLFSDCHSPVRYLILTFALALGLFFIWLGMFFYLSTEKVRKYFSLVMCEFAICGVFNYLFFGKGLPFLDKSLSFTRLFTYSSSERTRNVIILPILVILVFVVWKFKAKILPLFMMALALGTAVLGIRNIITISQAMPEIKEMVARDTGEKPSFKLSKEGNNVVVIMVDRAISCYVPYLFAEDPALKTQFDGFTWYPNTLSFGGTTNVGTPALFGGYEYQPVNINARTDLSLAEKQNEALRVMPVLFDEAGYEVTVCDPPYAGYTTPPDLSIYDDHPDIDAYMTQYGLFWDDSDVIGYQKDIWIRNFFCYAFTRIQPLAFQSYFYDSGRYHDPNWDTSSTYQTQYLFDRSTAVGTDVDFMYAYTFLEALPETTEISSGNENTFMMMDNATAHNVALLQEPEYVPAMNVDNTEYDAAHEDRFTVDGKTIAMDSFEQMAHYHSNMAAMRQLGRWFDYLREQGVYDNTRIILVSDHGYFLEHMEEYVLGHKYTEALGQNCEDILAYNAFLMVKDFGSTGFTVDNTFMTNADTPLLAFSDLISDPVNPATGNPVTDEEKYAEKLEIFYTTEWNPQGTHGNTFDLGLWFSLKGQNIFDPDNWENEGVKE